MNPKVVFVVFVIVIASFIGIYNYTMDENQTSEPLETSPEYPPSVNLAIQEENLAIQNEKIEILGGRDNLTQKQNLMIDSGRPVKFNTEQIQRLE